MARNESRAHAIRHQLSLRGPWWLFDVHNALFCVRNRDLFEGTLEPQNDTEVDLDR